MAVSHVYNQTVADGTATSVVRPSDWNSAHNQYYTVSGNTTNASTASGTNVVWQAGNNITLSAATNTIVISGPGGTISWWENMPGVPLVNTTAFTLGGSSNYVFPFVLDNYVSASYIRMPVSIVLSSTSLGTSAGTPTSSTFSQVGTIFAVIYSQGIGGNSRSLQYVTSASAGWTWQVSVTEANATNNWTLTQNITYPAEGLNTAVVNSNYASTLSTINVSTTGLTAFTGFRNLDLPFATIMTPGNYWMALQLSSTTDGGKNLAFNFTHIALSQANNAYNNIGAATNSTFLLQVGLGSWSTNTVGRTTSSIALTGVSSLASHLRPYFQFIRQA